MDAESLVLSIAIRNKDAFIECVNELKEEHFQVDANKKIFNVLNKIYEQQSECDLLMVDSKLIDCGEKKIAEYLRSIYTEAPFTFHFLPSIKKLKERYKKKMVYNLACDLRDGIKAGAFTIEEIEEKILSGLMDLGETKSGILRMNEYAEDELENIFEKASFQRTKLPELDDNLIGFFDTQLIVIAARPGQGKTSLALQIASQLECALFVSLEMSRRELYARLLSMRAKVEAWIIEAQKENFEEKQRVVDAHLFFRNNLTLSVVDNMSDINKILILAEREIEKGKCKSIFIDYLQLVSGGKGDNQNLKIADITRKCKLFALKNKTPVILLSQLNREMEKTKRAPVLADLRDSGSIEQDADRVLFIYDSDGQYEIRVAKNRKGKTAEIPINFDKKYTSFGTVKTKMEF